MKTHWPVIALVVLSGLVSCLNQHTEIVENYVVAPMGDSKAKWLIFSVNEPGSGQGIVPNVKAIGYDEDYIIARSGTSNYYLVFYRKNKTSYFNERNVVGPMNEKDFLRYKKELGISKLDFSLTW